MIASASTPGGLMSACLSAIQGYHASTRQAEQSVAAAQPQRAAPSGVTHLPALTASAAPVQEGAVSSVAVQAAERAYGANVAASNNATRQATA